MDHAAEKHDRENPNDPPLPKPTFRGRRLLQWRPDASKWDELRAAYDAREFDEAVELMWKMLRRTVGCDAAWAARASAPSRCPTRPCHLSACDS